jgi:hypothetical protein
MAPAVAVVVVVVTVDPEDVVRVLAGGVPALVDAAVREDEGADPAPDVGLDEVPAAAPDAPDEAGAAPDGSEAPYGTAR